MLYSSQNRIKPTKAAIELASHSLPILKRRLKELSDEKAQVENDIEYYEGILQSTVTSIADIQSLQIGFDVAFEKEAELAEYFSCTTYAEKILLITKYPYRFGRELIAGSIDVIDIISELESLKNGDKLEKIKSSVQSTISRLYDKGFLFKYRIIGTKGKYIIIHSDWLENGMFKEEYKKLTEKIEPA